MRGPAVAWIETAGVVVLCALGAQGLRRRRRRFDRVDDLRSECPAVVTVKCSFLVDHYVTGSVEK